MTQSYHSDEVFIECWNRLGSPTLVAKELKMGARTASQRKVSIESRHGISMPTHNSQKHKKKKIEETPHNVRRGINIDNGRVLTFSDAHFWPDDETTAFRALLLFIKEFKHSLKAIICNGDAFDGGAISRFPRIGWGKKPSVLEELNACKYFLGEIEKIRPPGCELIWTMGNHDSRYETLLAAQAPQFEGIPNFSLRDHFPLWKTCWSYWINEDTVVKHRWKGGWSAGRTNSLNAGVSIITGHTHVLAVQPITDYNGTRYGVQTGTLAEPNNMQFADYTEDNPKDWRSGFALLSFHEGRLLMPEIIQVAGDNEIDFRGCITKV